MISDLEDSDPTEVGDVRIVGRIGEGGSGVVYSGVSSAGDPVAVKVLHRHLAASKEVRKRLSIEAEALRRVKGNRTARILAVDADGPSPHLVMELVDGENLATTVARGPLTGPLLAGLVEGLVDALSSIHECGIIHRDLKPQNIIFGQDGVKVVDFGTSVLGEIAGATRTGELAGTPGWLSPEQALGHEITPASDIFNLGMIIAFAATGRHPFGEGRADAMLFRVVHGDPDIEGLPSGLRSVVSGCLSKTPDGRTSLAELRRTSLGAASVSGRQADADLTRVGSVEELGQMAAMQSSRSRSGFKSLKPPFGRRRILAAIVSGLLVAGVAPSVLLAQSQGSGPVTYSVAYTTDANPIVTNGRLEISSGDDRASIELPGEDSTEVAVPDVRWRTDEPLEVRYVSGFANDEEGRLVLRLDDFGNTAITTDWRVQLSILVQDESVTLAARVPEVNLLVLRQKVATEPLIVGRQNESEYLREVAERLREAQDAARDAQSTCRGEIEMLSLNRLRPFLELDTKYITSQNENRLREGGTFSEATYRSRITGLLSDMDAHRNLTRGIQVPEQLGEGAFEVAGAVAELVTAYLEVGQAWQGLRLALFAERPCTSGSCLYRDLYPGEHRALANAETRFRSAMSPLRTAVREAARDECSVLYPIPEN